MFFTTDAETHNVVKCNINEENISKDILPKIEDDLDLDEKISILFLLVENYASAFEEVSKLLNDHKDHNSYILKQFVEAHPQNWKTRLLEAICILPNRQIIKKLGLSFKALELLYVPNSRLCVRNCNPIIKCLYMLCEALDESETELLIQSVKSDIEYDVNLGNADSLELHILYWMKKDFISIYQDGKANLKNLLKHLKQFEHLEFIYEDLKKFENQQNVLDNQNTNALNIPSQAFSSGQASYSLMQCMDEDVRKIKTGLCIIISQMFFSGQKYDTRFGTTADCIKLSRTFKGFGFDVFTYENLKKDDMLQRMESIPKHFGTEYDCIFVCILSHGYRGGVIAADEEEVSIEAIEQKICSMELKDVIKVVIIQACQGETTGQRNSLTTDGPISERKVSNVTRYKDFCIFMSTIQGFVSVRHQQQGSWFIQELCSTLQSEGSKITFSQAVRKIMQLVQRKSGILNGVDSVSQLPELRSYRLLTDFQLPDYRECAS